jgi:SAM-dependent methyltransferase
MPPHHYRRRVAPGSGSRERAEHWNAAYTERGDNVGWHQDTPSTSLDLIEMMAIPRHAPVVDVGGGTSSLIDRLLERGFTDVTVLDISAVAIRRSRERVGPHPGARWLATDLLTWTPDRPFGLWHDRAVLHFLTAEDDRDRYRTVLRDGLSLGGSFVFGTFAADGPEQCSGLPVRRHGAVDLMDFLGADFDVQVHKREVHTTPGGTRQPFTWVAGRRTADLRSKDSR